MKEIRVCAHEDYYDDDNLLGFYCDLTGEPCEHRGTCGIGCKNFIVPAPEDEGKSETVINEVSSINIDGGCSNIISFNDYRKSKNVLEYIKEKSKCEISLELETIKVLSANRENYIDFSVMNDAEYIIYTRKSMRNNLLKNFDENSLYITSLKEEASEVYNILKSDYPILRVFNICDAYYIFKDDLAVEGYIEELEIMERMRRN